MAESFLNVSMTITLKQILNLVRKRVPQLCFKVSLGIRMIPNGWSRTLLYELLINPVSNLLDEPEIIILPDRNLYRVPFPALLNESGKYLSERFRISVVSSLSTLKDLLVRRWDPLLLSSLDCKFCTYAYHCLVRERKRWSHVYVFFRALSFAYQKYLFHNGKDILDIFKLLFLVW